MSDKSSSASGGVSVFGLLFVAFVVLKLCGVISWSWWWVTAPLWGPLALILAIAAIGLPIYLIVASRKK